MPIYEYQCLACKDRFVKLTSFSDSNSIQCPKCNSDNCQKLFSVFGIRTGGNFTPSTSSKSCGTCTASSCRTCH
ncbi:MAG: zinc ribbon domain-containing protein [bacterium]|nr:zinc ribbon domain-containing protein [bacterium]